MDIKIILLIKCKLENDYMTLWIMRNIIGQPKGQPKLSPSPSTLARQRLKPTYMAMDSLLASLWPGPAPAPAPAEAEERVFSYWGDTPTEKNAAPTAPAVDIDVYDEARLAPRPVQRAGSYDTDDLTDAELAGLGRAIATAASRGEDDTDDEDDEDDDEDEDENNEDDDDDEDEEDDEDDEDDGDDDNNASME